MRAITDDEIRTALRTAVDSAKSLRAWAADHGVSPQYVSDVLRGARRPGEKIIEALGFQRAIVRPGKGSEA